MTKYIFEEIDLRDADLPAILYKYRSAKNPLHRNILEKNCVYFAPYSSFNEHHEHNLQTDYDSVTEEDIYRFTKEVHPRGLHEDLNQYESRIRLKMQETTFYEEEFRTKSEEKYKRTLDEKRGVLSMSTKWDVESLWEQFADQYSGFVVGLKMDFMFPEGIILGTASPVHYFDPRNPPMLKALCQNNDERKYQGLLNIYSLPNTLQHENEYRLTKTLFDQSREFVFTEECLVSVYLGYNMSVPHRIEIINLVSKKYPQAKIYEQKLEAGILTYNLVEPCK